MQIFDTQKVLKYLLWKIQRLKNFQNVKNIEFSKNFR